MLAAQECLQHRMETVQVIAWVVCASSCNATANTEPILSFALCPLFSAEVT